MTERLQNLRLKHCRLLNHPLWCFLLLSPQQAWMQAVNVLHYHSRWHRNTGFFHCEFNQPQITQCNNSGQYVTPDLTVRPVPERHHADQIIILTVSEWLLHHIPVETGPYNLPGFPVAVVGDENVFSELVEIFTNPVVLLPKAHDQVKLADALTFPSSAGSSTQRRHPDESAESPYHGTSPARPSWSKHRSPGWKRHIGNTPQLQDRSLMSGYMCKETDLRSVLLSIVDLPHDQSIFYAKRISTSVRLIHSQKILGSLSSQLACNIPWKICICKNFGNSVYFILDKIRFITANYIHHKENHTSFQTSLRKTTTAPHSLNLLIFKIILN